MAAVAAEGASTGRFCCSKSQPRGPPPSSSERLPDQSVSSLPHSNCLVHCRTGENTQKAIVASPALQASNPGPVQHSLPSLSGVVVASPQALLLGSSHGSHHGRTLQRPPPALSCSSSARPVSSPLQLGRRTRSPLLSPAGCCWKHHHHQPTAEQAAVLFKPWAKASQHTLPQPRLSHTPDCPRRAP